MEPKLGLVLSGGGAKGAYQAGILNYMAEVNMQPAVVSGTSIGALNASIVSAQRDIKKAAAVLNEIWQGLGNSNTIQLSSGSKILAAASIFMSFSSLMQPNFIGSFLNHHLDKNAVLDDNPLKDILKEFASIEKINSGLPLYVSLYPSEGAKKDVIDYLSQICSNTKGRDSVFKWVQVLKDSDIHNAVLASASLPYLFKSKSVEGKKYRDGGMGGAFRQQGNSPVQPLVHAGCTHLVVSLLSDGSFFDRHDPLYKDVAIIEVRPKDFISTSMTDMLAFTPDKIRHWMTQGYDDAKRCIGESLKALAMNNAHQQSQLKVKSLVNKLENDGFMITP